MNLSDDNKLRMILIVVGLFLGLILSGVIKVLWFAFSGIVLGWRDSAPDWYFNIQSTVQTTITVVSIILTIVVMQLFFTKCKKRKRTGGV
jgi:thiamine transporter ThiT